MEDFLRETTTWHPLAFNAFYTALTLLSLLLLKKTGQGVKKGVKWAFTPKPVPPPPPLGELCSIILKELEGECRMEKENGSDRLCTASYRFSCVHNIYHKDAREVPISHLFHQHEQLEMRKAQEVTWKRTEQAHLEKQRQALINKHKSKNPLPPDHIPVKSLASYCECDCPACRLVK